VVKGDTQYRGKGTSLKKQKKEVEGNRSRKWSKSLPDPQKQEKEGEVTKIDCDLGESTRELSPWRKPSGAHKKRTEERRAF